MPKKRPRATDRRLTETRVFLFRAGNRADARLRAERIAREHEHRYYGADGDFIEIRLDGIDRVVELMEQEIKPGVEVFWDFAAKSSRAIPRRGIAP